MPVQEERALVLYSVNLPGSRSDTPRQRRELEGLLGRGRWSARQTRAQKGACKLPVQGVRVHPVDELYRWEAGKLVDTAAHRAGASARISFSPSTLHFFRWSEPSLGAAPSTAAISTAATCTGHDPSTLCRFRRLRMPCVHAEAHCPHQMLHTNK